MQIRNLSPSKKVYWIRTWGYELDVMVIVFVIADIYIMIAYIFRRKISNQERNRFSNDF